jgi:hypothetical protein
MLGREFLKPRNQGNGLVSWNALWLQVSEPTSELLAAQNPYAIDHRPAVGDVEPTTAPHNDDRTDLVRVVDSLASQDRLGSFRRLTSLNDVTMKYPVRRTAQVPLRLNREDDTGRYHKVVDIHSA